VSIKWRINNAVKASRTTGLPHIRLDWAADRVWLRQVGIVYYLERADGAVKIGYTQNYPQRRATLVHRHGPLPLVAWEPGSEGGGADELLALENLRHRQFAHLRLPSRNPGLLFPPEWFAVDDDLFDHVLMLRAML
jgi:hypothetical protein